jgi:hypothetical protein
MSLSRRQFLNYSAWSVASLAIGEKVFALTPLQAAIAVPSPSITFPSGGARLEVSKPFITLRWSSNGMFVRGYYLRMGTSPDDWDIWDMYMGDAVEEYINVHHLPEKGGNIYAQLLYKVVDDPNMGEELGMSDIVEYSYPGRFARCGVLP